MSLQDEGQERAGYGIDTPGVVRDLLIGGQRRFLFSRSVRGHNAPMKLLMREAEKCV